jgi:hypothetical protein
VGEIDGEEGGKMKQFMAAISLVIVCFGAWFYIDGKKADCADVQKEIGRAHV